MKIAYGNAAIWGLVAGIVMAMVMVTSALGMGFWTMLIMIAGIVLEPSVMMGGVSLGILILGGIIHMALSMMFGIVYAMIVNSVTHEFIVTGLLFGLVLWLFNFYVLGLIVPGAHMMATHEPTWLAVATHLVFGFTLGALSRSSASAIATAART